MVLEQVLLYTLLREINLCTHIGCNPIVPSPYPWGRGCSIV